MGGVGSGRQTSIGSKSTTSEYRSIDVRRWHREGLFSQSHSFSWHWLQDGEVVASIGVRSCPGSVALSYRQKSYGEDWKDESYTVELDWTPCNFGGERPWFLCPVLGCGERVALLYGGAMFACRHCHNLAYPSQREDAGDRVLRRVEKLRGRLGWEPGILNPKSWEKPKGMHWRTYERLNRQYDALEIIVLGDIAAQLGFAG